jgi:1,4-dihydroxy-2-naphthoyl-CoA hydrolase
VSSPFDRDALAKADSAPLVTMRRTVKFQEVDAAGTIYFPRILEYFADAYMLVLEKAGLDVPGMLRDKTLAAPLAHAEADFLRPLFFGDVVDVEVLVLEAGKTSATFGHRIRDAKGKPAAVGRTVHVFIDPKTFQPTAVPAGLAALANVGGITG